MDGTSSQMLMRPGQKKKPWQQPDKHAALPELFDKLPPYSEEAEVALLGSMLQDWKVCADVLQIIKSSEDFYKPAHSAIYDVLIELYDQYQSIDMVQVNEALVDKQLLGQVGGLEYLLEMMESVPSAVSAPRYARIVREKAMLRQLIDASGKILYDCYNDSTPVPELLDRAERDIFEVADSGNDEQAESLKELLQQTFDQLEAEDGALTSGLQTGYFELDEMTNGLQQGEMIIVAARPSMGKTALALNIVENIGADSKKPVAIFSLEMSRQQLAQRLLCARSGVDSHRLRRNMLSRDDFGKLSLTVGELSEAPIFIDDTPGLSLLALRAKARRLANKHDISAVIIDYLQLMSAPGSESRQQEVSQLSRGVKALARELRVPVVCLSQLNRSPEGREGHKPRMSDLRESGSIEQDADVVMMLHREDYYHRGEEEYQDTNTAELILAKQRNGPTGTVRLQFHEATTRFHNLAPDAAGGDDYE